MYSWVILTLLKSFETKPEAKGKKNTNVFYKFSWNSIFLILLWVWTLHFLQKIKT
jgi:hypothetical protein